MSLFDSHRFISPSPRALLHSSSRDFVNSNRIYIYSPSWREKSRGLSIVPGANVACLSLVVLGGTDKDFVSK